MTEPLNRPSDDPALLDYDKYLLKIREVGMSVLPSWVFRQKYNGDVLVEYLRSLPTLYDRQLHLLYTLRSDFEHDRDELSNLYRELQEARIKLMLDGDRDLNDELNALAAFSDEVDNEIARYEGYASLVPSTAGDEEKRPNQFTRKQVIYLLQELIPEFRTADNPRKAQFITKLTGYKSTKNIADEFSNLKSFADPELLAEWREKFKKSGRGRKKRFNP